MESYDYVIVGAGTSGCVLANRLSSDPSTRVLLIEAGPEDKNPFIHMPKGIAKIMGNLSYIWAYATSPSESTAHKVEPWVRGRTLGGSSAINGMMYVRGQAADYDEMAELTSDDWNWKHIGQAYKQLENHELGSGPTRGDDGWLHISMPSKTDPLIGAAIKAGEQLGLQQKLDVNDPEDIERIGYAPRTIYKGKRESAADAFLKPIRAKRTNLIVATGVTVDKVLIEDKRAVGVAGSQAGAPVSWRAKREVILCAGSMGSPAILQRSGVGPAFHLRSLGIDVVHDSPNLGYGLREHRALVMQWKARDDASENRQFRGLRLILNTAWYYLSGRKGPMSSATYEGGAWFKTRPGLNRPDGQFLIAPYSVDFSGKTIGVEAHGGLQICAYILRPESTGSVLIRSADPKELPVITANYRLDAGDRAAMIDLVRYARKFVSQPAFAGIVSEETRPGPGVQTDEEIVAAYDGIGTGAYHASCSCRMGNDEASVVDARAKVRGIDALRVVDTSIFPFIVAGNTNGPASAIAWRAADLIIADNQPR